MSGRIDVKAGVYGELDDAYVDRKTVTTSTNTTSPPPKDIVKSGKQNVLNDYRSVTYNFTLAALRKEHVNKPELYTKGPLELIILKSGGKGDDPLTSNVSGVDTPGDTEETVNIRDRGGNIIKEVKKRAVISDSTTGKELVEEFNKVSPGRFDMYLDDVEIGTLMGFTEKSNVTIPVQISFNVFEPYGINGFLEALHVTSVAAGYANYSQASFILKLEFWGYPDTEDFAEPVQIPESTRFFPISITGLDVDVTEQGTKYQVKAIPWADRAFGQSNTLTRPVKMEGITVGEILTNLMESINSQAETRLATDPRDRPTYSLGNNNRYFIKFPSWSPTGGLVDNPENNIAKSKLVNLYRDNALYSMADPATARNNAYRAVASDAQSDAETARLNRQAGNPSNATMPYNATTTVVQFPANSTISDIIIAVIKDSEYTRNIVENPTKLIDSDGFVDYFSVKIEVANSNRFDDVAKKPFQDITYVVVPFKVHHSRLPTHGAIQTSADTLNRISLREYNYLYTGENVDVLNFKLKFNTLFFEAIPTALGNTDIPSRRTGAATANDPNVTLEGTSKEEATKQEVPVQPVKTVAMPVQSNTLNAAQPLTTPYAAMAKKMHDAIINSSVALVSGELEIVGDPFYVAAGGIGSYNPPLIRKNTFEGGDVAYNYGDVIIIINFKNPSDIGQDGMLVFDDKKVAFSGAYKVTNVSSKFSNGQFKQELKIMRLPGQVVDSVSTGNKVIPKYTPLEKPKEATSNAATNAPSARADDATITEQLGRKLPNIGLPGTGSNFTAATGGLGGNIPLLSNQVLGAAAKNSLAAGAAVVGQPLPTSLSSSIRLWASGLPSLSQVGLSSSALVAIAANVVTGNLSKQRAVGVLAGTVIGGTLKTAIAAVNNKGSGIGEGKTFSLDPAAAKLPVGSISSISKDFNNVSESTVSTVSQLGTYANGLANGIGTNADKLLSTKADPANIGAKMGLDSSKLSGLSDKLVSKVGNQVNDIVKNIPNNVNLTQLAATGLATKYLSASTIKNLPASQLLSVAKDPSVAISKLSSTEFNPLATLKKSTNLVDLTSTKDKLASAKSQLSGITKVPNIPDRDALSSVSNKFRSLSTGQSPLDKLVNTALSNPNAPPYTGSDPIIRNRLGLPPV